jgi:uncharacterized protein (DUF849 family)
VRKCSSVLIKDAINGSQTKSDHPCVPMTPEEQMREARAAVAAGAGAIHVHVRDAAGRESLAPDDVARSLNAIRHGSPGTSVGISTGAWIVPNANERLALVEMWETLPDFASVNVHEEGAIELMRTLLDKGVGVEAGVWNANAALLLIKSGQVKNKPSSLVSSVGKSSRRRTFVGSRETMFARGSLNVRSLMPWSLLCRTI